MDALGDSMQTHRVYVNTVTDGYSLASYLLTTLGILGTVRESYVEVVLKPHQNERLLNAAVEEWVKQPVESDLLAG
jgi:hypothetical protein